MTPKYLSTGQMAKYLGLSKDFLLSNRGSLFIEGKHYFNPAGINKLLWNIEAMEGWLRGYDNDTDVFGNIDEIVNNILGG